MNTTSEGSASAAQAHWLTTLLFGTNAPANIFADLLLLGARLYAGVTIAQAGWDKLPTPNWMVAQVIDVGFPAPDFFASVACLTEFAGGILLALGMFTRFSAFLLAFTMGVASFGFQRVLPIVDMHIAQGFFWLFIVFLAQGGGRIALDAYVRKMLKNPASKAVGGALAGFALLLPLGVGLGQEFFGSTELDTSNSQSEVTSVSVAGSMNEWSLDANPLALEGDVWSGTLTIAEPGPIQFKFAANNSWDSNVGYSENSPLGIPVAATGTSGGNNFVVIIQEPGDYRFSIDATNFAVTVEPAERNDVSESETEADLQP